MPTSTSRHLRIALRSGLVVLAIALASGAQAQTSADTSRSRSPRPVRVWLSGGLGSSSYYGDAGIAIRGSASLSVGRAVLIARRTDAFEGIDGYSSSKESSYLAGARFGGSNLYLITAAGPSRFHWKDEGPCSFGVCNGTLRDLGYEADGWALGYDIGVHATKLIAGLAVNISGTAGPAKGKITALVFSVEFGWFEK